ncbi:MAG TPA: glycosyltransferase family 2 protein [Anaerolineales bacterium]|nr:glycosyltransferase family 2 protein [Anaerolineales bacterium]
MIYVITLNWNRYADTEAFLRSARQSTLPDVRFLVVDNGSSDGSPKKIAAAFPAVELISNPKNLGFAGGVNVGLRRAQSAGADYVFLANNDTLVAPDMLERLLKAARAHNAALVSPAIFYAAEPERIWSAGAWHNPLNLEVTGDRRGQSASMLPAEPYTVDFITACGMLIERTGLETIGLFDERFFMYYEDSDYCRRARNAGLRLLVEPRAHMWHKVSRSSGGSDSPNERYAMASSSVLFFRKHARPWNWPVIIPYRLASALRTTVRLARKSRHEALRAYWRGLAAGFRA